MNGNELELAALVVLAVTTLIGCAMTISDPEVLDRTVKNQYYGANDRNLTPAEDLIP